MTHRIQSLAEISSSYDALLCDLWGCVHNGVAPFPEALAALRAFRAGGGTVLLLTNAPRPASNVRAGLDRLGVPHDAYDGIVSSGDAGQVAAFDGVVGQRVWHLGAGKDDGFFTDGIAGDAGTVMLERVALEEAQGIICTGLFDDQTEGPDDYVERLRAARARDLPMLCVNPDQLVVMGERKIHCAGALARVYESMGGDVVYFGKPYAPIYDLARRRLAGITGMDAPRILAIGDGIETDIAGAAGNGIDALFVTGGIAAEAFGPDAATPDEDRLTAWLADQGQAPKYVIGKLG